MTSRRCSPNWVETYLEYTRFQNAPPRYHIWIALSIIASAIQRRVRMHRGFYSLYPNLYTCIIGPSGFTKSTAADIGSEILAELPDIEMISGRATSWYMLDWFGKASASGIDCVCTIYASEMKSLLGDLNKTELVTLLTDLYTSPNKKDYHTKGGGKLTFKNVCINVLCCSTPEWLTTGTSTDEIHGGFTGRFIFVFADTGERAIAFPEDFMTAEILKLKQDLIHDLKLIRLLKGDFYITDQAKAEYIYWYGKRKDEWGDERLAGYFSRKGDLVLKISMLLSLAHDDSLVIDENILHLAWKLLTKVEQQMGDAFSGVVSDPALKYKDAVMSQIARAPGQEVSRSAILKKNWTKFDGVVLDRIVANLIDAHAIDRVTQAHGREIDIIYRVKPNWKV